jgi:hypothetical protein
MVDNYRCAVVDNLPYDEVAPVHGVSARGTGWYLVEIPSTGVTGWVSPTVVEAYGDFTDVPYVMPPQPLPPTAPPPVQPTAPPPSQGNIQITGLDPKGTPTCRQTFEVWVNVGNVGTGNSNPGSVTLQDIAVRTGDITFTGYGSFPSIPPGGNYVVVIPVTTTTYVNETHELRAQTGGSEFRRQYVLAAGDCLGPDVPPPTTPPIVITATPIPPQPQTCQITVAAGSPIYDAPGGGSNVSGQVTQQSTYTALNYSYGEATMWYQVDMDPGMGNYGWIEYAAVVNKTPSCP